MGPDYFHKFSPTDAAAFVDRASSRMSNPEVALCAMPMCTSLRFERSKRSLRKLKERAKKNADTLGTISFELVGGVIFGAIVKLRTLLLVHDSNIFMQ